MYDAIVGEINAKLFFSKSNDFVRGKEHRRTEVQHAFIGKGLHYHFQTYSIEIPYGNSYTNICFFGHFFVNLQRISAYAF